jgi:hypothetical protein
VIEGTIDPEQRGYKPVRPQTEICDSEDESEEEGRRRRRRKEDLTEQRTGRGGILDEDSRVVVYYNG